MSNLSGQYRCPFKATIMTRQFGCEKAQHITRREGPDIACDDESAVSRCAEVFENLKQAALPVMGYQDDLSSMPASILQKIQFGGLIAIQRQVRPGDDNIRVGNIYSMLSDIENKFGTLADISYNTCADTISSYKLKKRRR